MSGKKVKQARKQEALIEPVRVSLIITEFTQHPVTKEVSCHVTGFRNDFEIAMKQAAMITKTIAGAFVRAASKSQLANKPDADS
jgi:hypothetical protein